MDEASGCQPLKDDQINAGGMVRVRASTSPTDPPPRVA